MSLEKRLGNLYGCTGGNYAGNVYDARFLAPAIMTAQGGGRQPHIIMEEGHKKCATSN